MSEYKVIGIMSGSSLDGVDIAFCTFSKAKSWNYEIVKAITYPYSQKWQDILINIQDLPEKHIRDLDLELGKYLAQLTENFINDHQLVPDFISSHGHTALHRPEIGITIQIGDGGAMAEQLRIPVINDFRSKDVSLGGQGAPLVPIGDELLFSDYDLCLNLGGFSNISFKQDGARKAFDICPVNMALNEVALIMDKPFDENGDIARDGDIHERLLKALNKLNFYSQAPPKSLGRKWYNTEFRSIVFKKKIPPVDLLATLTEHIATQISSALNELEGDSVLITGGGAYNSFLIERINSMTDKDLFIPDDDLIQYKEALIFAFLGVLRTRNEINVLSSVTGAPKDHCSGVVHNP